MSSEQIIVQQPEERANQLILLFHGVGDNPISMGEIGKFFALSFPQAQVISVGSPDICDFGRGFQWFSVQGVTEQNRQPRVDAAMPAFVEIVRDWQQKTGVPPEHTTLIGFSQGTIMALESTKVEEHLASRIVAFSGRFSVLPEKSISAGTVVHFIHGEPDPVINPFQSKSAAERLKSLGCDCTLNLQPGMGHGLDSHMINTAIAHLKNYEPKSHQH
ncbi:phospholipase/carboxylesterase [Rahnella sp. BIGb0603]|uniref:esterase n=1 Tax=Rahnella sp. BIGb0603 TaxID=2940612 RepID=UPI002168EB0E|nr:esterase [Rahnella sp. BIGb0603]MCS3422260.1 phospholipase/carboxylesterase [Rahnella sp. BIGb0603]